MQLSQEVRTRVDACKANGHIVKAVEINDKVFVYRSISRKEYRDIQKEISAKATKMKASMTPEQFDSESATLKDDAEELILVKCLVEPQITQLDFATGALAGNVTTLAELIMTCSGFGVQVEPETL